jgi:hypothetical protein
MGSFLSLFARMMRQCTGLRLGTILLREEKEWESDRISPKRHRVVVFVKAKSTGGSH